MQNGITGGLGGLFAPDGVTADATQIVLLIPVTLLLGEIPAGYAGNTGSK
ncbi:MAG TPA: hypothetical protein VGM27_22550 [Acidobacteriaceae bacterium]